MKNCGLLVFCLMTIAPAVWALEPLDAASVARGAPLYQAHCADCHGAQLEGEANWRVRKPDGSLPAPPHDDSGHTWHHGDGLLFDYTKLGGEEALRRMGITGVVSGMPAFGALLSDREIQSILTYIKSHWSEEVRRLQAERTRAEDGS